MTLRNPIDTAVSVDVQNSTPVPIGETTEQASSISLTWDYTGLLASDDSVSILVERQIGSRTWSPIASVVVSAAPPLIRGRSTGIVGGIQITSPIPMSILRYTATTNRPRLDARTSLDGVVSLRIV